MHVDSPAVVLNVPLNEIFYDRVFVGLHLFHYRFNGLFSVDSQMIILSFSSLKVDFCVSDCIRIT